MSVNDVLVENGIFEMEGHSGQSLGQSLSLASFVLLPWVKRVMEIGFNAGHSAERWLQMRPEVEVVSFDLGAHRYIDMCKREVDRQFPGRHELVLGDSAQTVPGYSKHDSFDLIFIDGDHSYEAAKRDLDNCKRFAGARTIIVMDDTHMEGPGKAWLEACESGVVMEESTHIFRFGRSQEIRAMSWGRFIL